MGFRFNHFNFNVLDLQKSLDFYAKALGLTTSANANSTSPSPSRTSRPRAGFTAKWAASAMKIQTWAYIL